MKQNTKKLVFKNTFYQLIARFVSSFNSLVTTIVISRFLGVTAFGDLVKIVSFTSLFYMPMDFGFNAVALKLVKKHSQNQVFSHLFLLRLFFSIILVIVCSLIAFFLPSSGDRGFSPLVKIGIYIMSLTIIAQGFIKTFNAILQHFHSYSFSLIAEIVNNIFLFVFLYFSIHQHHLYPLLWGYGACALAAALALAYLTRHQIHLSFSGQNLKIYRQLFYSSLPLGLTIIINLLATKIDLTVLAIYRPTSEVAFYGLAKRIFEIQLMFPVFFSNSLYPLLLATKSSFRLIHKSLFTMFLVAVVVALASIIFAPLLVLIKPDFISSVPLMRAISLSLPIYFLTAPLMWVLISLNQDRHLIWIYSISLLVSLFGNFILIPIYGSIGAVINNSVVEFIVLVLLYRQLRITLKPSV
jgi:O-antigen/teichoic acid export membrane protein